MERDTTKSYVVDGKTHEVTNSQDITILSHTWITAVIENEAADPGKSFYFYGSEPVAQIVTGSGSYDDNYYHTERINGEMLWITLINTHISGLVRPSATFDLEITDESPYAWLGTYMNGTGSYRSHQFSGGSWTDETLPTGTYNLTWNPGNLPEGIYFCRLQAGGELMTKKMIRIK